MRRWRGRKLLRDPTSSGVLTSRRYGPNTRNAGSICGGLSRDAPSPVDVAADDQVWKLAQIGETLPYYTVFAARPAEILKRDMDWAVEHVRRGIGEPELEELGELIKLNPRIDEAYAALEWHLTRDPSAGLPIPVSNTSFFLYKQSKNGPLTIPGIAVIYTIDLDELVICRGRFDFNEENDERDNEAEANEGTL